MDRTKLEIAPFSARVVAFTLDLGIFSLGYFLSLRLAFPDDFLTASAHSWFWIPLWAALFVLYQAFFSSGGRRSLGKLLVGLRVVDLEREPLTLDMAFARSIMYLVSSVGDLGFLWALFQPERRAWHDLVAGSVVIETRPRSLMGRGLLRAGACAVFTLVGGLWYWANVAKPRYDAIMDVAYAQTGLESLKSLEKLYYYGHGRFTNNLAELAAQSGAPRAFLSDMSALFDPQSGIKISADQIGYRIEAHANDDAKTLVALNGP